MPQRDTFRVFRQVTITEYVDIEAPSGSIAEQTVAVLRERGEPIDWALIGDETNETILYGETQSVGGFSNTQEVPQAIKYLEGNMIDLDEILEKVK